MGNTPQKGVRPEDLKFEDHANKKYPGEKPENKGTCETILNLDPTDERRINSILTKLNNVAYGFNLRVRNDKQRETLNKLEHLRKMVALYQAPELVQAENVPSLKKLEKDAEDLMKAAEKHFSGGKILLPADKRSRCLPESLSDNTLKVTDVEISSTANSNRILPGDATDLGSNTSDRENSVSSHYDPQPGINLDLKLPDTNEIPADLPSLSGNSQDSFSLRVSMEDPYPSLGNDIPEIDRTVTLLEPNDVQPKGAGARIMNFRVTGPRRLADASPGSQALVLLALPVTVLFYFVFKRLRGKSLEQEVIPMHIDESKTA